MATFNQMKGRLLTVCQTWQSHSLDASLSEVAEKANIVVNALDMLADFSLKTDPDRPSQFLVPFLVAPMLQLLEAIFGGLQGKLPLGLEHFPSNLYQRIVESRLVYSVHDLYLIFLVIFILHFCISHVL